MPNLVGFSIRNAEMYLKNLGLNIGDTTFRPDIAKNAVLEQLYNGAPIQAGTKIFMGSSISFVLGDGIGNTELNVPDLVGKTYAEAKAYLNSISINMTIVPDIDVKDTANAFVYRQNPEEFNEPVTGQKFHNKIKAGQSVDLWLSTKAPVKDTTTIKPPPDEGDDH
jgi:beta-lactam-binding protein with PASTA domain